MFIYVVLSPAYCEMGHIIMALWLFGIIALYIAEPYTFRWK